MEGDDDIIQWGENSRIFYLHVVDIFHTSPAQISLLHKHLTAFSLYLSVLFSFFHENTKCSSCTLP